MGETTLRKLLCQYYNPAFMDIVRELYNLPAIVPKQEYLEWYQKIEATGKEKALESFQYHGHLWHIL